MNCRICVHTARSLQNHGRVLWPRVCTHRSLLQCVQREDRHSRSRAPRTSHHDTHDTHTDERDHVSRERRARPPPPASHLPRVTFHIYINPTQRLPRSPATVARAHGTPHNFSRPTRYSTGDRPHEHTPRPTPQWQCFCPTAHCPHSLSAPPGHRALTETPARDVVEIWPRRRPGARARPLRPLCRESPAVSRGLRPSSRPPRSRRAGIARAGRTPARRHASLCPAPWSGPAPRRPRPGTGRVAGS